MREFQRAPTAIVAAQYDGTEESFDPVHAVARKGGGDADWSHDWQRISVEGRYNEDADVCEFIGYLSRGEWLVCEDGKLRIYPEADFARIFATCAAPAPRPTTLTAEERKVIDACEAYPDRWSVALLAIIARLRGAAAPQTPTGGDDA